MTEHQEMASKTLRNLSSTGIMGTQIKPRDAKTDGLSLHIVARINTNTYMMLRHMHTIAAPPSLLPVGSHPGANSDPDTRERRSKSLFSQVWPLLFIHETKRKGWGDSERERDRGIPSRGL